MHTVTKVGFAFSFQIFKASFERGVSMIGEGEGEVVACRFVTFLVIVVVCVVLVGTEYTLAPVQRAISHPLQLGWPSSIFGLIAVTVRAGAAAYHQ